MPTSEPRTGVGVRKSRYPLLPAISDPAEYQGQLELGVVFPDDSAAKRKLAKRWCEALPAFGELKAIEFRCHVSQELFDAACRAPKLQRLWVKLSGVQSIETAASCKHLHSLHLLDAPKLESLEPFSSLKQLRILGLLDFKKIHDISALGALANLEELLIGGGMYYTQRVDTLAPIGRLKKLRSLTLMSIRADDDTLRPLYGLSKLEKFNAGTRWKAEELAEIRRRNPRIAN